MFLSDNILKLEISNRKIKRKLPNTWKLNNNTLLNPESKGSLKRN